MRIGVVSDIHANLPALESTLAEMDHLGVGEIYSLGDTIHLGPYPKEVVELLLARKVYCILGDHEDYLLNNLDGFVPKHPEEREHYEWSNNQIPEIYRERIRNEWQRKMILERGVRILFTHYGLADNEQDYLHEPWDPKPNDLDVWFKRFNTDLVLYGHIHRYEDGIGSSGTRYVNPGAVGVQNSGHANFVICNIHEEDGTFTIEHHTVFYDRKAVTQAFRKKNVPNREILIKIFHS